MFPFDNLNLTIDSIYEKLLARIRSEGRAQDITRQFLAFTENVDKVMFVYDLIKSHNLIPLIVKEDKCDYTSNHFRNLGNRLYQRCEFYRAWQYYNLALMYAPLTSECYALAISNRSAALAGLKEYKACLSDIKMVFTLAFPVNIRDKLLNRKKKCEEALEQERQSHDGMALINKIFNMKGSKNEKYQCASSKLEVKYTPEMGRHVVAAEDIKVGEVIAEDIPYVSILLPNQILITCAHCFSRKFNLYPCPYCCMTMYCSRECVTQAWEQYHFYECPFVASLIKTNFTKLELLAFRTTIKARTDHNTWGDLFATLSEVETCTDVEELGCMQNRPDGDMVYVSNNYHAIHALATNIEKRDVSEIFQKAVTAAVLMHYLGMKKLFETDDPLLKKSIIKFAAETLLRHLMTAPTNMHAITANVGDVDGNYIDEYNIGSGAYAFLSLINHSCAPNVVRYARLGQTKMHLIALRPIKKGMQIFDNYGYNERTFSVRLTAEGYTDGELPSAADLEWEKLRTLRIFGNRKAHHAVHDMETRRSMMKSQYKFTCVCQACTEDWPLYHSLANIQDPPLSIVQKKEVCLNEDAIQALQKGDKKKALMLFKPLCELATILEPYIPCKEAAECQESLKQVLAILAGVLPHGFTKFVDHEIPAPRCEGPPKSSRFYTGLTPFDTVGEV